MHSKGRQLGVTLSGLIMALIVLGTLALLVMRLWPLYNEKMKVDQAMEHLAANPGAARMNKAEIVKAIMRQFDVSDVDHFDTPSLSKVVTVGKKRDQYLGLLGPLGKPLAFQIPYDITFAPDGNFYVIEYGAGRLSRIAPDGTLLGQLGHTGSGVGEFATPWGLTADSQMRLRIADTKNRRVVTLRLEGNSKFQIPNSK